MIKWYHIFLVDKEKDCPDGKLRFRVRWGNNIVAFNLGYRVDLSKWSKETQRCKNNTTHGKKKVPASVINREINRYEIIAENIFYKYEKDEIMPDKDTFRADFLRKVRGIQKGCKDEKKFFPVFDEFVKDSGFKNDWTKSTFEKFHALKEHLKNYKENISFKDFDEDGLNKFISYLRDEVGLRNTTIDKQLGFIKWFLRWATSKGYNNIRDYETFRPKLKKTDKKVIFLDWEELMTVYKFQFAPNKKYLERVRDVFCFCCFTSLRYSDVANLKWSDVGTDYIQVTTIKTNDTVKIELNDYSKRIIDKYKDSHFPGDTVLPVISNQKMNCYLKELGKICGINTPITITYYKGHNRIDEVHPKYELLGTHTGRRTFICNALMFGITPEIVMKWTGHSDYKTMKPYIDVADSAKKEAMKLFNKK